jgi:hypothetical protein
MDSAFNKKCQTILEISDGDLENPEFRKKEENSVKPTQR